MHNQTRTRQTLYGIADALAISLRVDEKSWPWKVEGQGAFKIPLDASSNVTMPLEIVSSHMLENAADEGAIVHLIARGPGDLSFFIQASGREVDLIIFDRSVHGTHRTGYLEWAALQDDYTPQKIVPADCVRAIYKGRVPIESKQPITWAADSLVVEA